MTASPSSSLIFQDLLDHRAIFLSGFQIIRPLYNSSQATLVKWLVAAHTRSGALSLEEVKFLFARYSASSEQIAARGHEISDFTHERWSDMRLFGGELSNIGQKAEFFDESVDRIFRQFYLVDAVAPRDLIHVTCTGYSAPSGAQRLVSARDWGNRTQVVHAYHMGCYAAHPAVRMAAGFVASSKDPQHKVDIVHTELCSLHLDPSDHTPEQLVIQSLFADGFIKYQIGDVNNTPHGVSDVSGLEVLAARDMIIPDSTQAMRWAPGPFLYEMELSRDVPVLLAGALSRCASSLFDEAGLSLADEKNTAVFAVHPGGPRIIELSEKILGLRPEQTRWSHAVLREHGNMSSATLPHIWQKIVEDPAISDGALVVSLGAGPGLTLSGALFRKRILS